MKLFAWNERRFLYRKDAQDLGLLMLNYIYADNEERLWEGDATDLVIDSFDYKLASARLPGRDVGELLTERSGWASYENSGSANGRTKRLSPG